MSQPSGATNDLSFLRFEHSSEFVQILRQLGCSLVITSRQSNALLVVGTGSDGLSLAASTIDGPTGISATSGGIAIATERQVWFLDAAPQLSSQIDLSAEHDTVYLARKAIHTGDVLCHELTRVENDIWLVNTLFSCLCTLHEGFSFVPRWRPRMISQLLPEDRCHLNGIAIRDGRPAFVTALSETDHAGGWLSSNRTMGCIFDVDSGETVIRNLCMPHSPRWLNGRLWFLESGSGTICRLDVKTGFNEAVERMPGFARGLAFCGQYAFVGLSKRRQGCVSGVLPIERNKDDLKCGICVIDLHRGKSVAYLQFHNAVEEISDLQVLYNTRHPKLVGPYDDKNQQVWIVPSPDVQRRLLPQSDSVNPRFSDQDPRLPNPHIFSSNTPEITAETAEIFNLANSLLERDHVEEAAASYEEVLRHHPNLAMAHCNLGMAYEQMQRTSDAERQLKRAVYLQPNRPEPHLNLALIWLLHGRFELGWTEYEWRWLEKGFPPKPPYIESLAPPWDGASLSGQSILVYGEQGIGDEIMFSSIVPELVAMAKTCIVLCRGRLASLFQRSFPMATIHSLDILHTPERLGDLGAIDVQIAAASAMQFLRCKESDFPQRAQLLVPDSIRVQAWKKRFNSMGSEPKVGVSWRGGYFAKESRRRSTLITDWFQLLGLSQFHFVNIQYGECREDMATAREAGMKIHCWPEVDPLQDMDEFAAQVAALDLIISVDNSTVHLAGALGKPVWLLLPQYSDTSWRWTAGREDSLWYPKIRIFRQSRKAVWEDVFKRAQAALANGISC